LDKPQYTSIPMEELRRIEVETQRTESVDELRALFDRVQAIRRRHIDDFDVQLAIGQIQQSIVDRGRLLLEASQQRSQKPLFPPSSNSGRKHFESPESGPVGAAEEEFPPHVEKLDARSWKYATYIGAFFAILLFAVFFYLIQTARRLNIAPDETQQNTDKTRAVAAQQKPKPGSGTGGEAAVSTAPALRLYTDLVPGTVTVDGGAPQPLQDGELQLDSLKPGHHTVRLTGRSGDASFEFDSAEKSAPRLAGPPSGTDVMVVTVSTQDGQGQLMTNAPEARVLLGGKDLGAVPPDGLKLPDLAQADHDLQIQKGNDSQRFVLTYIPAPALTVFVKSDLNAGSLVILAGEDGADIFIDDQKYRRKTDHGQLRIPTLKVGAHTIRVAKPGFFNLPAQTVQIKKGEEARLVFHLQPQPQFASLEITGAQPGSELLIDGTRTASVGADGSASVSNIKPGDHQLVLERAGAQPKQLQRSFNAGETVSLAGPDVKLEPLATAATSATPKPEPGAQTQEPAEQPGSQPSETTATAQPVTMPGSIHKGGGFLIYHTTKAPGHYSFSMQLRKGGGFMKSKRLQWFLGFRDTKNYVAFQVDGKHFTVRQVVDGKSEELQKVPFDCDPEKYVQIDLAVKQGSVDARLRPSDGTWENMGPVSVPGEDFTQGKFVVIISGNDEVGVSAVHYGK
jgi:hypothetical protein